MKIPYVIHDFLFIEELCNFKCAYCEGFYKDGISFKREGNRLIMRDDWKKRARSLGLESNPKVEQILDLAENGLEKTREYIDAPILKISGGEVYLIEELHDLLRCISPHYDVIQVLTNGSTMTRERAEDLKSIGNTVIQFSLDGHTSKINRARAFNEHVTKRVMESIEYAVDSKLSVEINCVLTKHNTGKMSKFMEYLEQYDDVMVLPRPVRGPPAKELAPTPNDVDLFCEFVESNKNHKSLPPHAYMERVANVLRENQRLWSCYVPKTVFASSYMGNVDTCTCGGLPSRGNIWKNKEWAKETGFNSRDAKSRCGNCLANYELLNLFIEGHITSKELKSMPLFDSERAINNLLMIKERLK